MYVFFIVTKGLMCQRDRNCETLRYYYIDMAYSNSDAQYTISMVYWVAIIESSFDEIKP